MVRKMFVVFRREGETLLSHHKEPWMNRRLYDSQYHTEVEAAMTIEELGEHGESYVVLPTYLKQC